MKIRTCFVSNSSSASFVIRLCDLTPTQLNKIVNHSYYGDKLGIDCAKTDYWDIRIERGVLHGVTMMTNFDMNTFLKKIGVNSKIIWDTDSDEATEELPPCDINCEECHMRFICYTQWGIDE